MARGSAVLETTAEVPVKEAGTNGLKHDDDVLSLDEILAADDIQTAYVDAPEWGGSVKVKSLSGEERGKVFAAIRMHAKKINDEDEANSLFYARVIAASLVNEANEVIGTQKHAEALAKKNGAVLTRVYLVCAKLSGIGEEEQKKALEDLKATPNDDTGSD